MIPERLPHLIGFCGFARSGKDTAFEYLSKLIEKKYDYKLHKRIAFADKIKQHLKPLSDIAKNLGYDVSIPENKEKFRPMYVEWSRVLKKLTDNDTIWLDLVKEDISNNIYLGNIVYITDVRYWYEVEYILSNKGKVIFLERLNITAPNMEEDYSFRQIQNIYKKYIDGYTVYNNGTKEELSENCLKLLIKEN